MWTFFWLALAVLVIAGFVRVRERLRRKRDVHPRSDEEPWRASLELPPGLMEPEEPLDMDEIEEEEQRFWDEERWDDADPF